MSSVSAQKIRIITYKRQIISRRNCILISVIKIQAEVLRGGDYRIHLIGQKRQQTYPTIDKHIV